MCMTGGPTLCVLRPTRLSEKDRQVSDLQVELSELRDSVELHRKKNNVGFLPPPPPSTRLLLSTVLARVLLLSPTGRSPYVSPVWP